MGLFSASVKFYSDSIIIIGRLFIVYIMLNDINKLLNKKIAVIGATGIVGNTMLEILTEMTPDILQNTDAYATAESKGKKIYCDRYNNYSVTVKDINTIDFKQYDIVLLATCGEVSKQYVPQALEAGCTVIDNSSYFRMNEDVPLVVPEININKVKGRKLIANPNCSTIQTVVPLKPLHDAFGLKELVISTYQSVSGAGRKGIHALEDEINEYVKRDIFCYCEDSPFHNGISFNVIPQIGDFRDLNYTGEEWKMINETKKILELPNIDITATCVRVPVFVGHSVSVFAKFEQEINNIEEVKELLNKFNGIIVRDKPEIRGYVTPRDSRFISSNSVIVSRIRKHPTIKTGLSFWCVADNLRKGAALNAIQIASLLDYD